MKRVLIAHNIEHQLFAAQIEMSLNKRLAKRLLLRDLAKLRKFETEGLIRAGNVIFLSSLDADYVRTNCPEVRSIIVPPLFGNPPLQRSPGFRADGKLHIGMLANFGWWPNREGLKWFVEKVFPYVSPAVRLHLFGARSEQVAPGHPRIQRHGYAASLGHVWSTCDIMIAPVVSEGGVSVKVAEAIYEGIPLLGSRLSARGLPLDPDPSIVLLDRAEDWIEFLNSGAEKLAQRVVPRSIADRFRADAHRQALLEFLAQTQPRNSSAIL
jgi:hypothetical protein